MNQYWKRDLSQTTPYRYTISQVMLANTGDDWIISGAGDDFADGGEGNDKLYGMGGADSLFGGAGKDFLIIGNLSGTTISYSPPANYLGWEIEA